MNETLYYFLKDFIASVQSEYDQAIENYKNAGTTDSKEVYRTTYLAYWIVLDKLRSQLMAFDFEEKFGDFVPELGKPSTQ